MTRSSVRYVSLSSKFAVFGIMLAVAAMITVYSVINGFKQEVYQLVDAQGNQVILTDLWDQDLPEFSETLQNLPYVKSAWKFQQGYGLIYNYHAFYPVLITSNSTYLGEGASVDQNMSDAYQVGEKLSLILPGKGRSPKQVHLSVEDVFSIVLPLPKGLWHIQVAEKQFQEIGLGSHSKGIVVDLVDAKDAYQLRGFLDQSDVQLFIIQDWVSRFEPILEALSMQQAALMMVLLLIVIVSLFSLVSGLMTFIGHKSKQFAMLRVLGLSKASLMLMMLYQGFLLSSIGAIFGCVLGYALSILAPEVIIFIEQKMEIVLLHKGVYGVTKLPVSISHTANLWIASMSVLLGVIASILPSIRLLQQNPAEALRNA